MNRAFGVFLTFLFLIIASLFFLWLRPVALPEPLKPVGNWFDERKSALIGGTDNSTESAATAPASGSAIDTEPKRVELASSRSAVAEVTVGSDGASTVQAPASGTSTNQSEASRSSTQQQTSSSPALADSESVSQAKAAALAAMTAGAGTVKETASVVIQTAENAKSTGKAATQVAKADVPASKADAAKVSKSVSAGTDSSTSTNQASQSEAAIPTSAETTAVTSESSVDSAKNTAAAAATNALAAATARVSRRAAALEQVERGQASQASETANAVAAISPVTQPIKADSSATAAPENTTQSTLQTTRAAALEPAIKAEANVTAGNVGSPLVASSNENQTKETAPVALLKPEVKARPPVTAAAVRQQQKITNYLEGRRVAFEVGRDTLSPRGIGVLDRLVPLIKANAGTTITIQGHTDDVGDYSSNLELSGARAIAARKHLISRGIKPSRLKVQGMGERFPIADNNTQTGRIRNRRIDFAVSDAG